MKKKNRHKSFFKTFFAGLASISSGQLMAWFIYCLLGSIPLVFGAVHPIVFGGYGALLLVVCGGWLLFGNSSVGIQHDGECSRGGFLSGGVLSFWFIVPLLLVAYVAFQAIPLPVPMVEFLSPMRAERMEIAANLGGVPIASISLSDKKDVGFYQALVFIGLIFYYFTLRSLFRDNSRVYTGVLYVIAALGAFEAFYGLLQFVKPNIGTLWLTSYGRGAHGTIIYKNQFASLMNMIWPLLFGLGALFFAAKRNQLDIVRRGGVRGVLHIYSGARLQAPLFIVLGCFVVLASIFSLSRGGILSCLFTGVLFVLLLPFSWRSKSIFFVLFFTLILGYGSLLGWDTIFARFDSVDNSASTRMAIYRSSVQMVSDHWLTGIGMGSYELLSDIYIKWLPESVVADRVHCEYLELMIELGVPAAALLFLWISSGICGVFLKIKMMSKESPAAITGIAAWCGLMSFLVHGFVDFGWRLPANLFYAVTLLALATGAEAMNLVQDKSQSTRRRKRRGGSLKR